jgi:hypothetical protein
MLLQGGTINIDKALGSFGDDYCARIYGLKSISAVKALRESRSLFYCLHPFFDLEWKLCPLALTPKYSGLWFRIGSRKYVVLRFDPLRIYLYQSSVSPFDGEWIVP